MRRFRQARARQIERLFFADGSPASRAVRCRRTLARLANAGLLGRLERAVGGMAGSEGFIYQRPRSRRRLPDLHTLTTTELYVRLREAERTGILELLVFEPEPYSAEWVEAGDVEPDAFARIRLGARTYRWFFEADEDSEDRGQMFAKFKQYSEAHAAWPGRVFPSVLFVVPNERRKHLLGRWVKRQPEAVQHLFYVSTLDETVDTLLSLTAGTEAPSDARTGL